MYKKLIINKQGKEKGKRGIQITIIDRITGGSKTLTVHGYGLADLHEKLYYYLFTETGMYKQNIGRERLCQMKKVKKKVMEIQEERKLRKDPWIRMKEQ